MTANGSQRWKAAVAAYRQSAADDGRELEGSENASLDQLAGSDLAANAVEAVTSGERAIARLLRLCIQAQRLCADFPSIMEAEQRFLDAAPDLEKSIASLRDFLDLIASEPAHPLGASVRADHSDMAAMHRGLGSISTMIASRKMVAEQTKVRLGETRKNKRLEAGRIAAIGWIAAGVDRITGSRSVSKGADLAEAVLGGEVMIDQARHAATLMARDWRGAR